MWVYDLQTLAFLTVNDAAVSRYGYSRDEFLSMTIMDIRPSEDIPLLLEDIVAVDEGIDYAGFWRHLTKDGTLIDVEIISHTLSYQAVSYTHLQGIVIDISERKRAEEALRHVNRQLRMISDCNQALIRSTDESDLLRTCLLYTSRCV